MTTAVPKKGLGSASQSLQRTPDCCVAKRLRTPLLLAAVVVLLGLFAAQGWQFIRSNSQTFDEAVHLTAGYSYLATGDFRLNPEHPPLIKLLSALPLYLCYHVPFEPNPDLWQEARAGEDRAQWWISRDFLYGPPGAGRESSTSHGSPHSADQLLALGRVPNLVLGTCLIALIGWWSFRLWGAGAALVASCSFEVMEECGDPLEAKDFDTELGWIAIFPRGEL